MREGGSIPVTLTFATSLGVNVLLLPMGRGDDGAQSVTAALYQLPESAGTNRQYHSSTNEKIDRANFIEGVSKWGGVRCVVESHPAADM